MPQANFLRILIGISLLTKKSITTASGATLPVALTALFLLVLFLWLPTAPSRAESAGWALQFDGTTDLVLFTTTNSMLGTGWEMTKTVSLWVKPTSSTLCANHDVVMCDAIFGDRPRWWGIAIGDTSDGSDPTKDRIWVWNYDEYGLDAIGVEYTLGEWVNITLVHEAGILRAYKNGIQAGFKESGATVQPNYNAQPVLQLGGVIVSDSRNWTFEGQIDEVQLWNRALTPSEINQYLYLPPAGNEPGLRANYRMSDGPDSPILTDDSLFDWTGILVDGASGVQGNGTLPLWVTSDLVFPPLPMIQVYLPMLMQNPVSGESN